MNEFLRISTNAQIANGIVLIVILLMYIAYKLSEPKRKRPSPKNRRLAQRA